MVELINLYNLELLSKFSEYKETTHTTRSESGLIAQKFIINTEVFILNANHALSRARKICTKSANEKILKRRPNKPVSRFMRAIRGAECQPLQRAIAISAPADAPAYALTLRIPFRASPMMCPGKKSPPNTTASQHKRGARF